LPKGVSPDPNNGYLTTPTRSVMQVQLRQIAQVVEAGSVIDTVVIIVTS